MNPTDIRWDNEPDSNGVVWDDKVAPEFVRSVIKAESNFNPNAVSPKGAQGLMQIIPSTGRKPGFGVKPLQDNSTQENIRFGTDYLSAMGRRYNWDANKMLIAYNAGPDRADKGIIPKETRGYIPAVLNGKQTQGVPEIVWDDQKTDTSGIVWDNEQPTIPKDYLLAQKPTGDYAKTIAKNVSPTYDRSGEFTDAQTADAIQMGPLRSGKEMLNDLISGGESALQTVTGLAAMPVAGIGGLLYSDMGRYPEAGEAVIQGVTDALTYKPQYNQKKSQQISEVINKPLELMETASDYAGGKVAGWTGQPELGAVTKTAIMMALPSIMGKGLKTLRGVANEVENVAIRKALIDDIVGEAKRKGVTPDEVMETKVNSILEGFQNDTPPSRVIKTPEVTEFADRIAKGEKITSPEDIQFYENNKGAVEAELVRRMEEQKRTAEEPIQTNGGAQTAREPVIEPAGTTPHQTALKLEAETIAKELVDKEGFGEDIAGYQKKVGMMAREAEKALAIIESDPQTAIDMALGKRPIPEGMYPGTMVKAVSKWAVERGDTALIQKLGTSHEAYAAGTEAARGLKSFDVKLSDDPVQAVREVAEARGKTAERTGRQANPEEVERLTKEVERLQTELDSRTGGGESGTPKQATRTRYGSANKIINEKSYLEARESLRQKMGSLSAGVDPTTMADLAKIGVYHIEAGTRSFAKWSFAVVKDLGTWVKPHLNDMWKASNEAWHNGTINLYAERIGKMFENGAAFADIGKQVNGLARHFVEMGVKDRSVLVDSVHRVLKDVIPDITKRDVADAISGYGKFKQLSKDEVSVILRDLKGQLQQISKLEDLRAKGVAQKTGLERRTPSDAERALIKQVEEFKRKYGIQTVDKDTMLKSALDAVKTRLKNQITDLESQITSRQKIIKERTGIQYDAEANRLKAKRDELKKRFDDIFGEPKKTPSEKYDLAQKNILRKQIEALEKQIQSREKIVKQKMSTAVDKETFDLQQKRDVLKKEYNNIFQNDEAITQHKVASAIKSVEKSIAEYERRIRENDVSARMRGQQVHSEELDNLRAKRDALKEQYQDLKDSLNPKKTPEEIALQRLKTRMTNEAAKYSERLKNLDFAEKEKRTTQLDPEALRLKEELNRVKKAHQAATEKAGGITADEVKNIVELSDRIRNTADGTIENGVARRLYENYLNELKGENAPLRTQIGNRMAEFGKDWKGNPAKAIAKLGVDVLNELVNNSKAMAATLDVSYTFRQGMATLQTHPLVWANSIAKSYADFVKILGGKKAFDAMMSEVYTRKNFLNGSYDTAKLIPKADEWFPPSVFEHAPGLGRVFRASEETFRGSLIRMRVDLFDLFADKARKNGIDITNKKWIEDTGTLVNAITAKGKLGKTGESPVVRTMLWAPRMLKANWDIMTAHTLGSGLETAFARKQAALNTLTVVGETAAFMYIMSQLLPGSIEWNPKSPDFGKLKVGRTRFDFTQGKAGMVTLAARLITGETKNPETKKITRYEPGFIKKSRFDAVSNFLINKSPPATKMVIDSLRGRNFKGEKFTLGKGAYQAFTPISVQQTVDLKGNPSADAIAGVIADIFGVGSQTYDKRKPRY